MPEKALIARIRRIAARRGASRVLTGIGDDSAVLRLRPGQDSLVTTDFSIEGIHFRRDWHPAESVGYRCLARGLSDIAAMGGEPIAAFLSLAVPRDLSEKWIDRFLHGLLSLAKKHDVTLSGGDTAESPHGVVADIVVVGGVPKGKAILRSGARHGDRIYASGALGGSAAAIREFQSPRHPERPRFHERAEGSRVQSSGKESGKPEFDTQGKNKPTPRTYPRHFYPEPRLELGRILRESGIATAMIDTSDGLSTDLAHICEESRVGAEISAELIPRARVGKPAREVPLDLALHGGEDYELLFTARANKRIPPQIAGVPLTCIGVITRSSTPTIFLGDAGGAFRHLRPQGWEHFRQVNM